MSLDWLFGDEASLLDPWFLAVIPLVWLTFAWRIRRPRAAVASAATSMFAGLPRSVRSRLTWLPLALLGASATLLAVALARPVTRDVVPLRSEGVDILLLLDTSSSMNAQDVERGKPTRRMDAARERALEFAESRENDRVGMMTFARYADMRCPPTLDMEALAAFLRSVDTVARGGVEDMTAIGGVVAKATSFLAEIDAPSRIAVLLSDGEETAFVNDPEFAVNPKDAAKLAADEGVRVHTIGLGQGGVGIFGQVSEPDFSTLEFIAEKSGGRFFRARTSDDLAAVYAEIDRMEKRELDDPRYRTTDWFVWPLGIGAALFVLGLLLEFLWIRGLP